MCEKEKKKGKVRIMKNEKVGGGEGEKKDILNERMNE